jgi:hypothetical protein
MSLFRGAVMREDDEQEPSVPRAAAEDDDNTSRRSSWFADEAFMSAVILRPREPFLEWVRQQHEGADALGEAMAPAVAITPELPRADHQDAWLRQHSDALFVRQLEVWAVEAAWPTDRSVETLRAWFDIEFVPAVDDMRDHDLRYEITCAAVSLAEVVDQFETIFDGGAVFVDVTAGTIVAFNELDMEAMESGDADTLGISDEDLTTLQRVYESPSLSKSCRGTISTSLQRWRASRTP